MALHDYPWTEYEEGRCFGDCCKLLAKAGVKLAVANGKLQLLNSAGHSVSEVTISVSEVAERDTEGRYLTSYLINAGTDNNHLIFTDGRGYETVIEVPYSRVAEFDTENARITSYVKNIQLNGDKVKIFLGDGSSYELIIPFAVSARTDVNNKLLTSYAASIAVDGQNLVLKDGNGQTINTITVSWAERSGADSAGNTFVSSYGSTLQAGTTTVKLLSPNGTLLSEITCPYSTMSLKDTDGNLLLSDYAETLSVAGDGKSLTLKAHDGTNLSTVLVPFSTLSTDSINAVERVEIVGDQIVFTTYGGVVTRCTIPYSLRATSDGLGNEISETYIADVQQDALGVLSFYDKEGNVLCSLTPSTRVAIEDDYGNLIADYIKSLVFDNQSNYLVATHGDGTTESIVVNYSNIAWKDSGDRIIKNYYLHSLACIEDEDTHHSVLVGYNGDDPNAEILRIELTCYMAQRAIGDVDGDPIDDTYVASGALNSDNELELKSKQGTVLSTVAIPKGFEVDKVYHYRNAFRMHQDTLNSNVYPNVAYPTFLQEYAMKSGGYSQNKRPFTFGYYDMDVTTFKDTDVIMIEVGNVGYHYDVAGDTCMTYPDNGYVRYVISLPSSVTIAAGATQKVVVDAPYLYMYQSVLGFGVPKFPPCVEAIPDAGANTTVSISHRTGNLDNGYYVLDITNDSASPITVSSVICFIDMKPYANALAVKPLSPSNPDIYAVPGTYLFSGYTLKELIPMCLSIGTLDSDDEYTECPIPYYWNGSYVHGKIKIVCPIAEDVVGAYNDIWGVQYLDASGSHAPNDTPSTIPSQYVEKVSDGFIIDLDTWMNDTGDSAYAFRVWIYDDNLFGEYYTVWY